MVYNYEYRNTFRSIIDLNFELLIKCSKIIDNLKNIFFHYKKNQFFEVQNEKF